MKFTEEQRKSINQYILLKIDEKCDGLSKYVSEAFKISTSTVHNYLKKLIEDGIIVKDGKDKYSLKTERSFFSVSNSAAKKPTEESVFRNTLMPKITDLPSNVKAIWEYSFTEMVNNAIEHSESDNIWILIEKNALNTSVYIMDDGIGVFRKIQEHFDYDSLDDAVIELSIPELLVNIATRGLAYPKSKDGAVLLSKEFIISSLIFSHTKVDDTENLTENNSSSPSLEISIYKVTRA